MRCAFVFPLLVGFVYEAQAVGSTEFATLVDPLSVPEKGKILQVHEFRVCKDAEDVRSYLSKMSRQEAEEFFYWKRRLDRSCLTLEGPLKVLEYSGIMQANDGMLRCILKVEFESLWDGTLAFYTAWPAMDFKSKVRCRAE